ncbi:MAG: hypothetical protein QOE35_718 [Actinomycetota bacterium]|jgi:prepilin-type N-terminal cleavage/methylation domain-containing protein
MQTKSDAGFTLIEVLLATVILAVIFGAITEAMVMGLRTSDSTDRRLRESIDAQVLATVFGRDVQSAQTVSTTVDPAPAEQCGTGTLAVSLRWTDPKDVSPASATRRASYFVAADPIGDRRSTGEERVLTRAYCEDGALVSERQVARYLASGASAVAIAFDDPVCPDPPVSPPPCRVALTATDVNGFKYRVEAVRRSR